MKFVNENPKLIITAVVGVGLWAFQKFVLDLPADVEANVTTAITGALLLLVGRFSRVTKSEAKILERMDDSKNQL